jgi:SAM-dependent methyltransferase
MAIAELAYLIITANYQLLLIHSTFLGLLVFLIIYATAQDAPYVPTPEPIIRKMLEMADVKSGETVYDLGSGDGRILVVAAREFGAKAVGIEISHSNVTTSLERIRAENLQDRIRVEEGNFFKSDISDADVVILYLRQNTNDKVGMKLKRELKPGTRVVSRTFTIRGWMPSGIDKENQIYLYKA